MTSIDKELQFSREERAGLYRNYKYPNLVEVRKQDRLYIEQFANITSELLFAAFRGEEELTGDEIWQVARYNGIPLSVLTCPKLIMLDNKRIRHRNMVERLRGRLYPIWQAEQEGIKPAVDFMKTYASIHREKVVNMYLHFINGDPVSYVHYLGVRAIVESCTGSVEYEKRRAKGPRGCKHEKN